jgi:hypothetical protein
VRIGDIPARPEVGHYIRAQGRRCAADGALTRPTNELTIFSMLPVAFRRSFHTSAKIVHEIKSHPCGLRTHEKINLTQRTQFFIFHGLVMEGNKKT